MQTRQVNGALQAIAALVLTLALWPASANTPAAQAMASPPAEDAGGWVHARDARAELAVRFERDATTGALQRVHYRVRNLGQAPLMTLDGGSRQASRYREQAHWRSQVDGTGRMTLELAVQPLPTPAPTVPVMTVAARLDPGQVRTGVLDGGLDPTITPARSVRLCLGLAPWDPQDFLPVAGHAGRWTASFRLAQAQALLCSDWAQVP